MGTVSVRMAGWATIAPAGTPRIPVLCQAKKMLRKFAPEMESASVGFANVTLQKKGGIMGGSVNIVR